jgi:DNA-binding transcriptional MerR regulator
VTTSSIDDRPSGSRPQPELSVGLAAAQLGVAAATLRSWGRRYGLAPAGRSPGGHRRYTQADMQALLLMQLLIDSGSSPSAAARQVLARKPAAGSAGPPSAAPGPTGPWLRRVRGGPGGRVLAVPGASPEMRGLSRAASRLDHDAVVDQLRELFVERGAVRTWDEVLRPVLTAAGDRWMRSGGGIETEHVLSEGAIEAIRAYRSFLPRTPPARPVLLAGAPSEQHTLPLHILAAALTEQRIAVRVLGGQVPAATLLAAARRIGARTLFIWRQLADLPLADLDLGRLPSTRPQLSAVVGGPGWDGIALPAAVLRVNDLGSAVRALRQA